MFQFVLHMNNIILVLLHMHNSEFDESQQQQKYEKKLILAVDYYKLIYITLFS